jgi:hypothetical protein
VTPRTYRPPQRSGRRVYGALIAGMVVVAFVLQFLWMRHIRASGPDSIAPNTLADRLSHFMLQRRSGGAEPTVVYGEMGTERVTCEACMGVGAVLSDQAVKTPCPICQGVGFRIVRRFDDEDRICPMCIGMGRVAMPDTGVVGTCPRCDGRGLVRRAAEPPSSPNPE